MTTQFAIGAPGRPSLQYSALRKLNERTRQSLRAAGITQQDRVAIVLPNGPEMATAFVTIAGAAVTAPLNPGYKQEEFAFYLDDLKAKALVVEQGSESPAVAAATGLGIQIIPLQSDDVRAAGDFDLQVESTQGALSLNDVKSTDIALILHTSGTTSRPKIVPLSHANVCASADNIGRSLVLIADDVCLNVMPLFSYSRVNRRGAFIAASGREYLLYTRF